MANNVKGLSGPDGKRSTKSKRGRSTGSARPVAGGSRGMSRRDFVRCSAGAALAIGGLAATTAPSRAEGGTVVVMAWENYVHAEIQKRFHDATGITVRGISADSDQDMFTKLKAGG